MALQEQKARVWLFYLKHLRGDRGTLEFKAIQEICAYLTDCLELAEVTRTFLRFFNCRTSAWGPSVYLKTLPTGEGYSTWVILKDRRLFYSGGMTSNSQTGTGAASICAYLLDRDGAVEELPNMLAARMSHGIIQVRDLYIFGGSKL
jgi:hypothetical protein